MDLDFELLRKHPNKIIINEENKKTADKKYPPKIEKINCEEFESVLFKNTMISLLKNHINSHNQSKLLSVTMVDISGSNFSFVYRLLKMNISLTVLTENKEIYFSLLESISFSTGAIFAITDLNSLFENKNNPCDFVFCFDKFENNIINKLSKYTKYLFLSWKPKTPPQNKNIFFDYCDENCDVYDEIIPQKTNKHLFLSAIYNFCYKNTIYKQNYKGLSQAVYRKIAIENQKTEIKKITELY